MPTSTKLKFGHHGANHPVREERTGVISITSQNHGYAVDADSLPPDLRITHVNLNDGTVEGLEHRSRPVFAIQYHPEAAPVRTTPSTCSTASSTPWSSMPKRTDIARILMLGAGPIVIGQACEFDYSGTQACKALREDGYQVVLLNSNPATIMTDPEIADRTYVEPITLPVLEQILARERPDAVLTTLGGQTALNLAVSAAEAGMFERYGVEMLGADLATIQRAENREQFRSLMQSIGLAVPPAAIAHSLAEVEARVRDLGLPVVCVRATRWAAPAAASPTPASSCATSPRAAWSFR